ncbi:MAG: oligosaccharide flippase family protein [Phycisphaerae bacterium]|nr:oligosaccharide flippase family protein [Phycisphaerae bacterium]
MSGQTPALAAATARGFFWMTFMGLATKVVGFVGQIALARVLRPDDFGLLSLAFTVSTFADLVQSYGLREVLVRRREKLRVWSGPAIWLSLVTGLSAGLAMAAAAPIAAAAYGKGPVVAHLILLLALTAPINALGIVPDAALQQGLRFKAMAFLLCGQTIGYLSCTLMLALLGFGAYSFALSMLMMSVARTACAWWLTRPRVTWRPRLSRSLRLLRPAVILVASAAVMNIMAQGDKLALGLFHSEAYVGAYFFAYNLSLQTAVLLSLNFARVLFPVMSRMQDDPARLRSAFIRAARTLMFLGAPLCFLQAAAAGPFIRGLVQSEKWLGSIPALQILSLGMAAHMMWNPSRSLIQVQGRYRFYLRSAIGYAAGYCCVVFAAAKWGDITTVALAVAGALATATSLDCFFALRRIGGTVEDVARIMLPAMLLAAVAAVPAWSLEFVMPSMPRVLGFPLREVVLLAAIPVVVGLIYVPLLWWFAPDVWVELSHRMGPRLRRLPGLAKFAARFRFGSGLAPPAP